MFVADLALAAALRCHTDDAGILTLCELRPAPTAESTEPRCCRRSAFFRSKVVVLKTALQRVQTFVRPGQ